MYLLVARLIVIKYNLDNLSVYLPAGKIFRHKLFSFNVLISEAFNHKLVNSVGV